MIAMKSLRKKKRIVAVKTMSLSSRKEITSLNITPKIVTRRS
jgi:hypothetical protein